MSTRAATRASGKELQPAHRVVLPPQRRRTALAVQHASPATGLDRIAIAPSSIFATLGHRAALLVVGSGAKARSTICTHGSLRIDVSITRFFQLQASPGQPKQVPSMHPHAGAVRCAFPRVPVSRHPAWTTVQHSTRVDSAAYPSGTSCSSSQRPHSRQHSSCISCHCSDARGRGGGQQEASC